MLHIKSFTFNPFSENTYLLFNDSLETVIIDPGAYFAEEKEQLLNYIDQNGLHPVQLWNTHCHLDHVFANDWVYTTFGLELHIHAEEEQILVKANESGDKFGLPFKNYTGPIHFINENTPLYLDNERIEVLLTPGHSPGSISFYSPNNKFILSGDVLFRESIGRTDLFKGNYEELLQSIKEKLFILPDETTVFSGHGSVTTIGYEKLHNPFL